METLNTDTEPMPAATETAAPEPETAVLPPAEPSAVQETAETPPAPVAAAAPVPPAAEEPPAASAAEEPVPSTAAPLPDPAPQSESENEAARRKQFYWNRVLTGDAETVPADVRERCGFAKGPEPVSLRGYRMLGTINRSWAADHLGMTKEQVSGNWESLRGDMARELGVESNENEVFAALSRRAKEEEAERRGREIYEKFYTDALLGETGRELPAEGTPERRVADAAAEAGAAAREEQMPMTDHLLVLMKEMAHAEDADGRFARMFGALPWLMKAVDDMAEMEEDERARLYAVLQSRLKELPSAQRKVPWFEGVARSVMRGGTNVAGGVVQAAGNVGAGALQLAADATGWQGGADSAEWTDARLRILEELRQYGQQGAFPIELKNDWGMGGRIMLSAAEAAPSVALSLCGGVGAAVAGTAALGDTVAEARNLCPEGKLSAQTFAGILGLSVQNNLDMQLESLGKKALQSALQRVAKVKPTFRGQSVLNMQHHLKPTMDFVRQLAMAPAGQGISMAAQEAAAQCNGVASHIDWQSFGDNALDVEANLKNAAVQLPLILIAGGQLKLHHFKNPRAVLGDGAMLRLWGLEEGSINRIMAEQDTVKRGQLLQQELAGSRRWSSPSFFPEIMQAMKLLHTEDYQAFNEPKAVRDFLELPYLLEEVPNRPSDKGVRELKRLMAPESAAPAHKTLLPFLRKMEEWAQRAAPQQEKPLPGALQDRTPRYLSRERRLARRIEARHALRELERHSYRLLLNRYSLDSLLPLEGKAERHTEQVRREVVGRVARAVVESAGGMPLKNSVDIIGRYLLKLYEHERDTPYSPDWLRTAEPGWMQKSLEDALHPARGPKRREQPRVAELQSIARDLQGSVQELLRVLPQTDDFQSTLARCGSVQQAYAHLLHRELKLENKAWMPAELRELPETRLTPETAAAFAHYSELTGVRLEQESGEGGRTYWRVRRPDGAYTPWHDSSTAAVNDLVANTELNLLPIPMGRDGRRFKALRSSAGSADTQHMNAFDQMSRAGADDLLRFWRDDATLLTPGVQVRQGSRRRLEPPGQLTVRAVPVMDEVSPQRFQVSLEGHSLQTPYGVVMARLFARWQRAMNSGVPTTRAAADFLARRGLLTPEEVRKHHIEALLQEGEPERPALRYWYAQRRQVLTRKLAEFSMGMFLHRLAESPHTLGDIPPTAREWFATAPFYAAKLAEARRLAPSEREYRRREPQQYSYAADWMHRVNIRAVEDLSAMRGMTAKARAAEQAADSPLRQDPFYNYLEEALVPSRVTRLEQGWSYFYGGKPAVNAATRDMQNLLEHPDSAWRQMSDSCKQLIREQLPWAEFGGQPSECLGELAAVLKAHPELNEYSLGLEGERLWHLEPDSPDPYAPSTLGEEEVPADLSKPYRPSPVLKCGRITPLAELPPQLAQDARVMPALRLMRQLRLYGVNQPMETENGIIWKGERYGGEDGRNPHSGPTAADWKPHRALDGLLRMLNTVHEVESDGGQMTVGGVQLRGLPRAEGDAWLNHVTVYRYASPPERVQAVREAYQKTHPKTFTLALADELGKLTSIMRLMPGERDSGNDLLRVPYVVHAESGLPFTRRALWRGPEHDDDIYQPLAGFASELNRNRAGRLSERLGRRFVTANVEELLRRTADAESLEAGRYARVSNRELLMQLAEDTQFSYTLEDREPEHLSPAEAAWVRLFGSLLRYEYGGDASAAQQVVQDAAALNGNPAALKTLLNARYGSVERKRRTWRGRNVPYGFRKAAAEEFVVPVPKQQHPLYQELYSEK